MKLSFRWFGDNDPVKLSYIRQIPMVSTIVTDVKAEEVGGIIPASKIKDYKGKINRPGLKFEVFESLPVHYSIKLGLASRDKYIDNYKKNIRMLGAMGIKVIAYNFRPIFRWARTDINKELLDKSTVSVYDKADEEKINPFTNCTDTSQWHKKHSRYIYERQLTTDLTFDGYYTKESTSRLRKLRQQYQDIGKEGLWKNLQYFLNEIIPVAESCDVKMAIHPDDPPWDIFGVPRLITDETSLDRLLDCYDSPHNCITLCSGTLASIQDTNIINLADKYSRMDRIAFAHIRNVKCGSDSVEECAHYSGYGSIDMVKLLDALYKNNYDGYIRSDHGRMIWGEEGKPGNGIYDRALGAQYILGIWECLENTKTKSV
ncbi:mannonate dehydratase [Vallitalea longa]|uniref:Mannonate dehydratase n=1 Tax=Vallitalea longa TaxID=2936439 RepID=A0A9W5YCH5_9FIRM|nr:mannonate dehydratase [Vallitalea longa]GKX29409.1 mannonate dehydratase [Vallitalea longa]